jgi:hypothetical protein
LPQLALKPAATVIALNGNSKPAVTNNSATLHERFIESSRSRLQGQLNGVI